MFAGNRPWPGTSAEFLSLPVQLVFGGIAELTPGRCQFVGQLHLLPCGFENRKVV